MSTDLAEEGNINWILLGRSSWNRLAAAVPENIKYICNSQAKILPPSAQCTYWREKFWVWIVWTTTTTTTQTQVIKALLHCLIVACPNSFSWVIADNRLIKHLDEFVWTSGKNRIAQKLWGLRRYSQRAAWLLRILESSPVTRRCGDSFESTAVNGLCWQHARENSRDKPLTHRQVFGHWQLTRFNAKRRLEPKPFHQTKWFGLLVMGWHPNIYSDPPCHHMVSKVPIYQFVIWERLRKWWLYYSILVFMTTETETPPKFSFCHHNGWAAVAAGNGWWLVVGREGFGAIPPGLEAHLRCVCMCVCVCCNSVFCNHFFHKIPMDLHQFAIAFWKSTSQT